MKGHEFVDQVMDKPGILNDASRAKLRAKLERLPLAEVKAMRGRRVNWAIWVRDNVSMLESSAEAAD
jgi:hypothetical protein